MSPVYQIFLWPLLISPGNMYIKERWRTLTTASVVCQHAASQDISGSARQYITSPKMEESNQCSSVMVEGKWFGTCKSESRQIRLRTYHSVCYCRPPQSNLNPMPFVLLNANNLYISKESVSCKLCLSAFYLYFHSAGMLFVSWKGQVKEIKITLTNLKHHLRHGISQPNGQILNQNQDPQIHIAIYWDFVT